MSDERDLFTPPTTTTAFVGWARAGDGNWQAVVFDDSEDKAWRALLRHRVEPDGVLAEKVVLRKGDHPSRRPRWGAAVNERGEHPHATAALRPRPERHPP